MGQIISGRSINSCNFDSAILDVSLAGCKVAGAIRTYRTTKGIDAIATDECVIARTAT